MHYLKEVTFCTWFEAVRAVLPRGAQYTIKKENDAWRLAAKMEGLQERVYRAESLPQELQLTSKQQQVLSYLQSCGECSAQQIKQGCGAGDSVVKALLEKGCISAHRRHKQPKEELQPSQPQQLFSLTPAQQDVSERLQQLMHSPQKKPALLHGITGSGKTAVFISLVQAALDMGKTALVLVPEIGLTPQMVQAMCEVFGQKVALMHSGLSSGQRMAQWLKVQSGRTPVVVGTRSAIFAPLENIGVIIIDEEQEHTYQSESAPRYNAIDIARRRAGRHGALLLLASATPSVSSYYAAEQGRYELLELKQRYGELPLPTVTMVDMGAELLAGNSSALSRTLQQQINQELESGGQVILLLNRRGYHRVGLCRDCGKAVKCEECSVPMVFHKYGKEYLEQQSEPSAQNGYLLCHHCGIRKAPAPSICPECGADLRYAGYGTQKLEDELAELLPKARVLRMDMDTTQRKDAHANMLKQFANGEYNVLLGTQMVAKGLNFERVRLVGVIGIDSLLFAQGYKAYEHVFSLVTQVVGRSGRKGAPGQAIIQTLDPQNPVLQLAAKQDYKAFYQEELSFRSLAFYPPLCSLCIVGFAAKDEKNALEASRRFAALLVQQAKLQQNLPLQVFGPSPMQLAQLAGSFRYRLTLKCANTVKFRQFMREVLHSYNQEGWPRKVTAWVDFNSDG